MRLKIAVIMVGILAVAAAGLSLSDVSAQTLPINPLNPASTVKVPGLPDLTSKGHKIRTFVDDLRDQDWIVIGPFEVDEFTDKLLRPVGLPDKKATPYSLAGKTVTILDSSGHTSGFRTIQPGTFVIMAIKGNAVKLYVTDITRKEGKNEKS
jgi:hypothetical protein